MKYWLAAPRSATRLFAVYALLSLVPVLVLGLVLAHSYRSDADARGLAEAQAEAQLLGSTAISPLLPQSKLGDEITPAESTVLREISASAINSGRIVRLRLRSLDGTVVFSSDGSGFGEPIDADALSAARGNPHVEITDLNADENPTGPQGIHVVEVYWPLRSGYPLRTTGVLEVYLPYGPIAQDVDGGLHRLYRDLALGLGVLYFVLAAFSISATRRLRRQVSRNAYLAEHDALTGLPNRALFHRLVEEAVAAADRGGLAVTVAVIDLDRFKEVNDTLGHGNGDALLSALSRRLENATRSGDTVSRLGGDEFGLVLIGSPAVDEVVPALERLRQLIQQEVDVGGLPLSVEASIGFAMLPEDGHDVETLLQHADVAMYVAKGGPAGVVRYDAGQDHYDSGKLALLAELRRAIVGHELVLHFQPKASLVTGRYTAVEALVRWNHPERGLLFPDAFIPTAEQTGIIDGLTRWVLDAALAQLLEWGDAAKDLAVAVNVSARSISRADFADSVIDAVSASGLPVERLLLEITETAFVADPERASLNLGRLAAAGIRISLDDFGRGQTSLGYLSTLPLHEVKIDRSFVSDMLTDRSHAAIVRSVIDLAHNLGFEVVAEGVETQETLDELRVLGCDIAQGYLLARPMPAAAIPGWLADHHTPLTAGRPA
jgi:diguanylate cyclase